MEPSRGNLTKLRGCKQQRHSGRNLLGSRAGCFERDGGAQTDWEKSYKGFDDADWAKAQAWAAEPLPVRDADASSI